MRRVSLMLCLFVWFACCTSAIAQDPGDLTAAEFLRWFPNDMYDLVTHEEIATKNDCEVYEDFRAYPPGWSLIRSFYPLPRDVLEEAKSITFARLNRVFVYMQSEDDAGEFRKESATNFTSRFLEGKQYVAEGMGESLVVLRYEDPQTLIRRLAERGRIAEAGVGPKGLKMYRSETSNMGLTQHQGRGVTLKFKAVDRTNYLVVLEGGEILSAESEETLARMLRSGTGEESSILDDPEYEHIAETFEFMGHFLEWSSTFRLQREIIKHVYGPEDTSEKKELYDTRRSTYLGGFQEHTMIWDYSSPMRHRLVSFYQTEEAAKKMLEGRLFQRKHRKHRDAYSAAYHAATKYEVDGTRLISTTTYTEEVIQAHKKRNRGWKKKVEKEDREKLRKQGRRQ